MQTLLLSNICNLPLQTQNLCPEDQWKILLCLRENQSLGALMFQLEDETSQSSTQRKQRKWWVQGQYGGTELQLF